MVPRDLKHQNALASQPGAGATGSGKPYADEFHWTGVACFFHSIYRRWLWRLRVYSEGWGDLFGGFAAVNWFRQMAKGTESFGSDPTLNRRT
jgi:hypothetical protein